jgi:tetratricopeptide (TPR) repeat protein
MESSAWRRIMPARIGNIVIVLAFVLVIAMVLLAAFRPNRGAVLFDKAQRLESAGQWEQALGHYRLLVETEPDSSFAPRALMQQATILEGMARRAGKPVYFQQAIETYQRVARRYSNNTLAGQALLQGADLAATDLNDYAQATALYQEVLTEYSRNADYVSQATLALGRVALAQKNAPLAQKYFRQVLAEFSTYPDRCAEAQYQSGVVAETLTRQPEIAKEAYQATIKNYPATVWATNAKARLGMLFYGDIAPGGPARRVMTRLTPLPDTGYPQNSLFLPLALVLSARGMDVGPATLNAWSLQSFFCGYDPGDPGRGVKVPGEFENAVANAGLSFSVQNGKDAKTAFADLREAVDHGHTPVIFMGKWILVAGYDTVAQLVFLQEEGAQTVNMPIKELMLAWGKSIPDSTLTPRKPFTFLSFRAEGDKPTAALRKNTQSGKDAVRLFMTPSFDLTVQSLSRKNAQRRTVRRAGALLSRAHAGDALLNVEALNQLASDLGTLGTLPPSPVPVPEGENAAPPAEPVDWQQRLQRARHLAPWFGKPLQQWIEARRDGAVYLESVSRELGNKNLQDAASELRHSVMALQNAEADFPEELKKGSVNLWTTALGQQLRRTAQDLREAETAESQAAQLMRGTS